MKNIKIKILNYKNKKINFIKKFDKFNIYRINYLVFFNILLIKILFLRINCNFKKNILITLKNNILKNKKIF